MSNYLTIFQKVSRFCTGLVSRRWLPLLCGLAFLFRIAGIGNDGLWYDEAFTANLARLPLPQLFNAIGGDVHPPLFYIIEWIVGHLAGYSAVALRLPSAAFSTLAVMELSRLASKIGGTRSGQIAGALLAIMPAQLNYAQEARSYALLTWLVLATGRAIVERRSGWLWALFPAMFYTHYMSALYMLVLGPAALLTMRTKIIRQLPIMALLTLPWLPSMLNQFSGVASGFWVQPPTLGAVPLALLTTTLFTRIPPLATLHLQIAVVLASVVAVGILIPRWRQAGLLLALALVPHAALMGISEVFRPLWIDRLLIPAGGAMVGVWAVAAAQLFGISRPKLARLAAIVLPSLFIAVVGFYARPDRQFDYRALVNIIMPRREPCDVVYHLDTSSYVLADYYMPTGNVVLPLSVGLAYGLTDTTKNAMMMTRADLVDIAGSYCRAWLISVEAPQTTAIEEQTLHKYLNRYRLIRRWSVYHEIFVHVDLYLLKL